MATFQTPWWRIALRGWICSSRHAAPRFAYPPIRGGCLLLPWRHPWPTLPKSFFPSFISTLGLVTTFSTILSLSLSSRPSISRYFFSTILSILRTFSSSLPSIISSSHVTLFYPTVIVIIYSYVTENNIVESNRKWKKERNKKIINVRVFSCWFFVPV